MKKIEVPKYHNPNSIINSIKAYFIYLRNINKISYFNEKISYFRMPYSNKILVTIQQ